MTTTIRSSADGSKSYLQVGGSDVVTIGDAGIEAGSYAPESITPDDLAHKFTQSAAVSATGTAIDFTGIPSWAKRVTIDLTGISTSGSSILQAQIGSSTGIVVTGYESTCIQATTASVGGSTSVTTGFYFQVGLSASSVYTGRIILDCRDDLVVIANALGHRVGNSIQMGAGSITLSAALERVRITTVNGTDTFDAGTIAISWE